MIKNFDVNIEKQEQIIRGKRIKDIEKMNLGLISLIWLNKLVFQANFLDW